MKEKSFNLENSYMGLPNMFYREQKPSHVPSPELVVLNYSLIEELGLNVKELESSYGVEILSGNKIPEGGIPIAKAYGGHQFGHFTMLGDGRAVLIGEQITPRGHRVDIELKGSGKTPYSRGGDGKATLGSMLREYIISEAMNGLGIPSTRSLAVVTTGETIFREKMLHGAVLTRIASSHIRVGTFQYASKWGDIEDVKALADYTLERHFKDGLNVDNKYLYLLKEVIKRQAELIAKWQLVGFIHGVMNTDNMTISGETIDYGPCAFMDTYDPATVFSS
ncbi:MAG: protein adenylyltransferase SelO family protein, partial [Clostridium sp.]